MASWKRTMSSMLDRDAMLRRLGLEERTPTGDFFTGLGLFSVGVLVGAGPRATQALLMAARAIAAIAGRDFVIPDDIKTMAVPVLEHRLILRPEFEIEGLSVPEVIQQILQQLSVPR